jgi:hypothetical protein
LNFTSVAFVTVVRRYNSNDERAGCDDNNLLRLHNYSLTLAYPLHCPL